MRLVPSCIGVAGRFHPALTAILYSILMEKGANLERIDTISAIRKMAAEAGMSLADISEQTGKGRKNLSSRLYLDGPSMSSTRYVMSAGIAWSWRKRMGPTGWSSAE